MNGRSDLAKSYTRPFDITSIAARRKADEENERTRTEVLTTVGAFFDALVAENRNLRSVITKILEGAEEKDAQIDGLRDEVCVQRDQVLSLQQEKRRLAARIEEVEQQLANAVFLAKNGGV